MTGLLTTRAARTAFVWCAAYTALVDADERERRRTEMLGHLWEHEQHDLPVLRRLVLGCVDDLRWCDTVRRGAGGRGLLTTAVFGATGGLVTAGFFVMVGVLVSFMGAIQQFRNVPMVLATIVFLAWTAGRLIAGARRRRTLSSY